MQRKCRGGWTSRRLGPGARLSDGLFFRSGSSSFVLRLTASSPVCAPRILFGRVGNVPPQLPRAGSASSPWPKDKRNSWPPCSFRRAPTEPCVPNDFSMAVTHADDGLPRPTEPEFNSKSFTLPSEGCSRLPFRHAVSPPAFVCHPPIRASTRQPVARSFAGVDVSGTCAAAVLLTCRDMLIMAHIRACVTLVHIPWQAVFPGCRPRKPVCSLDHVTRCEPGSSCTHAGRSLRVGVPEGLDIWYGSLPLSQPPVLDIQRP